MTQDLVKYIKEHIQSDISTTKDLCEGKDISSSLGLYLTGLVSMAEIYDNEKDISRAVMLNTEQSIGLLQAGLEGRCGRKIYLAEAVKCSQAIIELKKNNDKAGLEAVKQYGLDLMTD